MTTNDEVIAFHDSQPEDLQKIADKMLEMGLNQYWVLADYSTEAEESSGRNLSDSEWFMHLWELGNDLENFHDIARAQNESAPFSFYDCKQWVSRGMHVYNNLARNPS